MLCLVSACTFNVRLLLLTSIPIFQTNRPEPVPTMCCTRWGYRLYSQDGINGNNHGILRPRWFIIMDATYTKQVVTVWIFRRHRRSVSHPPHYTRSRNCAQQ